MALVSRRPTGIWFKLQAATFVPVKFDVLTGQVPVPNAPKGSRTKPDEAAVRPVTGSTWPAVTGRVVPGSRMVPVGRMRPSASVWVAVGERRSLKLVYPLLRSAMVGTVP